MNLVAYMLIVMGMIWCSVQDLKTCTVTIPPLLCWCSGSVIHVTKSGIDWGLLIAIIYTCLLYQYMCFADWVAIYASVVWFDIPQAVAFFFIAGLCCVGLQYVMKQCELPMMPCIALGWCFVHFFDAITYGFFSAIVWVMTLVSCNSASVAQVCEQYIKS